MGPYRDPGDAESKDLTPARVYKPQRVGVSGHGMISTQHFLATEAGVRVLAEGGNAIDAAVAAAFALGVCEPAASGLGGQTMMLIHAARSRRTFALDGSSRAPNRTVVAELPRSTRRYGYKATTVPSTPAVLAYALQRYGSMPLAAVIEPAVELAERGYRVSELQRGCRSAFASISSAGPPRSVFSRTRPARFGSVSVFTSRCWPRRSAGWVGSASGISTRGRLPPRCVATWRVRRA